jgi:hypothetical protein
MDIAYIRPGMPVNVRLDAFPRQHWTALIEHIEPRAEFRDDESVFITELELENTAGNLRPGMKGRAKIYADRRPLGWSLFHKAWDAAALRLGW